MGSTVRQGFWSTDWFAGLLVAVVFFFAWNGGLLQSLERTTYDMGVRMSSRLPSDRLAVVAIDKRSIDSAGRWPLPRAEYAQMIDILREGEAKVVALADPLVEPQRDPGLSYISDLEEFYLSSNMALSVPTEIERIDAALSRAVARGQSSRSRASRDTIALQEIHRLFEQSSLSGELVREMSTLRNKLAVAEAALNPDSRLADSMRTAGNTLLGMSFGSDQSPGNPDHALPEYVLRSRLMNVVDRVGAVDHHWFPPAPGATAPPIPELGMSAAGIGHIGLSLNNRDSWRTEPLVLLHQHSYLPSLALQLAARSLDVSLDGVQVLLGEGIRLGDGIVATDPGLQMFTFYYGNQAGRPPFPVDSFTDVLTGGSSDRYRDKVVLVGTTAPGLGASQATPISSAMPTVMVLAHSVSTILNGDFFVAPPWQGLAEYGVFVFITLYLMLALPRLKASLATAFTALLVIALPVTQIALMASEALVLELTAPASLLVVGYLLLAARRALLPAADTLKSEADSAESNRMLGLAFQGQGQLDMAFEKFRKCPLDNSTMDLLYNLGLDFERKRQFAKAVSVYQYMCSHNSKFRDIEQRMTRTRALEETVMLGGIGVAPTPSLLVTGGGGIDKPMLGRYQVEKELGKGAMGVVYLGKDPKLNRIVAIKTMALSQEFDEDELEDVKERFFREAETAGRLTHPNIVTIYEAGEEHDLAYIAMELLDGEDLVPFTKPENLLPVRTAIVIVAQAAEALDYAHAQNVVHRDIKPANLMYESSTGKMKITDFGIARITDANKTKTGMVLGTPSYMSPEQLAGQKVDGRSDLFSLAVMLFQLVTGFLPFQGDSMATLMLKIANDDHPDVTTLRSGVPPCLKPIVDKALNKDRNKRYQRGQEMAQDLRACVSKLPANAGA